MQRDDGAAVAPSALAARIHFPPWNECMRGSERTVAAAVAASDKEAEWRDGGSVEFRPSGAVQRNQHAQKHIQVAAAVGGNTPTLGSGDHSAAATTVTGSIGSCSRSEGISMRSSSSSHSGVDNHAPLFDSLSPVCGVAHWSHRSQGSGEQQLLHSMRELSRLLTTQHAPAPTLAQLPTERTTFQSMRSDIALALTNVLCCVGSCSLTLCSFNSGGRMDCRVRRAASVAVGSGNPCRC